MADLPNDWYIENDGRRLVLDAEKVQQAISHLELWNREYRKHVDFWKARALNGDGQHDE